MRPVTQTAEVLVKRASRKDNSTPGGVENGNINSNAPIRIRMDPATATTCPGAK